ncbi:MAG: CBS domain-containing protein [Pseudomonadota bacterium]
MPASYRPPVRGDAKVKTVSQSKNSNMSSDGTTVQLLLDQKGGSVFSIKPEETLGRAVEELRDRRIGALMVTDESGILCGILSERDIVRKLAETPGRTLPQHVEDVMTRKVEVCTPNESLVSVLRRMSAGKFRHMPVVEKERLVGLITIGDVVNFRLQELEHEALQLKQLIVG